MSRTPKSRTRSGSPASRGRPREGWRSKRNIGWIEEHCRIPEGRDVGKRVRLRSWQKRELRKIYDNPHGTRRALISFGRKNAKTTLAAFLLQLHLCGPEARPNSQLVSAAQSREQAAILFSLAAKSVRLSPTLGPVIVIRDTLKELACPGLGTLYKALSAEASTAFGLSPVFLVHDELGQVRGPRSALYEALETAVGAHDEPLSIVISTQAPSPGALFSILLDDALAGHDPRTVVSLYTAPLDLDPFAVSTIRLANPAFGDFLNAREVLAMAEDARRMPSREAEYRNLILNQRVEATAPFVSLSIWRLNGRRPIAPEGRYGLKYYGGLDLSEVNDLTALVIAAEADEVWNVWPTFWLPAEGLAERSVRDRVPYDMWARQGFLTATPGKSIDYEYVAAHLRRVCDELEVGQIAFDRHNFRHLRGWLLRSGFSEVEVATTGSL